MARVIFCEKTSDIQLILSRQEAVETKRQQSATPFLNVRHDGNVFRLFNPEKTKEYIDVLSRQIEGGYDYMVKVSDRALDDLLANRNCGTRYMAASKFNIHLEENA